MAREFDDAAFERRFARERMVEDLLRGFAPATVAHALDFATLEQLPATTSTTTSPGARATPHGGCASGARRTSGSISVLLEFQSTVDPRMAARILAYTARMYLKLVRGGELPSDGVIYNGERRWSAATEMLAAIAPVGEDLVPFQPRQRHLAS